MQNGTLIGPYRMDGLLGRGGMAEVYKAWHTGLHRHEALKVPMLHQAGADGVFIQRFLNEARIAAGLHHPHIATIFSVSDASVPHPYFSMELIEGGNLEDLIAQNGRLQVDEALAILQQVGEALDHAHEKGVAHRDIKPGNILLQRAGNRGLLWNAKVVDFGIARAGEDPTGKRLTKAGMVVGTPDYMSPEQGGSGVPIDYRTDIYSLGIVAYRCCAATPLLATIPTLRRSRSSCSTSRKRRARFSTRCRACRPPSMMPSCGHWPRIPTTARPVAPPGWPPCARRP